MKTPITVFTHAMVDHYVKMLAVDFRLTSLKSTARTRVYPVPRGGVPVAYALRHHLAVNFEIVDDPGDATIFLDDIIDSGATLERYAEAYPGVPFLALVNKTRFANVQLGWVVFPWERGEEGAGIEDSITRLIQYIGDDPKREGLAQTPARVAKAWRSWGAGYGVDPESVLKTFVDGSCDEMVVVRDIPFYSMCEHHMAPFFGTADIGYIPQGRIVGLSKLPRLLEVFARRLQVQERMTSQVADALEKYLQPKGVGVIVRARHLCMESRGIERQGSFTETNALRGVIKTDAAARAEFLGRKP